MNCFSGPSGYVPRHDEDFVEAEPLPSTRPTDGDAGFSKLSASDGRAFAKGKLKVNGVEVEHSETAP